MLTNREKERFHRQIIIDEMGVQGQLKLKQARVLIAGAGGLGSPASIFLSVAGVGTLGIVDHDTVALSNLNRQILHAEADIGQPKCDSARKNLKQLNATTKVEAVTETLTEANVNSVVAGFGVVIDALDNLSPDQQKDRDHPIAVEKGSFDQRHGFRRRRHPGGNELD